MTETVRACLALAALSWRTSRLKFVLALALVMSQSLALPLAAPLLARITDAALAGDVATASWAAAGVAVLAVAGLVGHHYGHIAYFELGELNFLAMDRELVELSNGSTGLEHHERPEFADKVQVLKRELDRVGWVSMSALMSSVSLAVALTVTAVLLATTSPWLLLLPAAAVPPLLAGRRAEAITAAAREASAGESRGALHLFRLATDPALAKEVRACRLGPQVRVRHARRWRAASAVLGRAELQALAWRSAGQVFFAVAYVSATLLVVRATVAGRGSVGDVVLVLSLAAQVNQQVISAVTLLQELQRLSHTLAQVRWLRQVVEEQRPAPADLPLPDSLREGIRLRGVSFSYPGTQTPVLADVDLLLPAGSSVAIVGENGAGKSTLVKLLCRFYETDAGVIEVDGVDLRRLPLPEWRERTAAGFQDFARLEFDARRSIGLGDLPRSGEDAAVLDALARANGSDLLARLDAGLDTALGLSLAGGTQLSGGQWQKLALGRAMMRRRPLLLVFDEPTAALDAQAEHQLFERYAATAREVGKVTGAVTVLVSHRFSTVRMADLILVVAGGRIAEAGTHEELSELGGLYAQLYGLQAAQYR
ncbi:MAG: ABC transporter ATP-binding protein [Kineosporiaceae bacterium]